LDGIFNLLSDNCQSNSRLYKISKWLEVVITGMGHQLFGELCVVTHFIYVVLFSNCFRYYLL